MASEAIRNVVIRIALEQTDNKLQVPDTKPVTTALDDVADKAKDVEFDAMSTGAEEAAKDAGDHFDKLEEEINDVANATDKANRSVESFGADTVDEGIKASEGFKTAGEGAFTLARGVAFLTTDTDEGFQQLVKNIAAVQGAFDVFSGGIDTIKGLVEGTRALKAATGAATVAEAALATANTAVAATGRVAAAGMATLNAALGPIGLALTGITVAVGAVAAAWAFFGDEAPAQAAKAESAVEEVGNKSEEAAVKVRDLNEVLGSIEDRAQFELDINTFKIEQGLATVEDRIAKLREQQAEAAEEMGLAFIHSLRDVTATQRLEDFGLGGALEAIADNEAFAEEERIQAAETLERIASARMEREEGVLSTIEDQVAAREKELDKAKESLQTAKEQLATEQDRVESLDEVVGRMNAVQRAELKRLGEKVERGEELSKQQLLSVERLAGPAADEFVSEEFAERGREAGGAGLFDPFQDAPAHGEGSALAAERDRVSSAEEALPRIEERVREIEQRSEEVVKRLLEKMEEVLATKSDLEKLEQEIDRQAIAGN